MNKNEFQIIMERINELLEKYFRAETTIAEESELKQYFRSTTVKPEHDVYKALFQTFDEELSQGVIRPVEKVKSETNKSRNIWIQSFIYTGIAASLVLTFWVKRPTTPDNVAMVSGNKIQDTEFAEKYAEKKLNHVNEILNRSLKPVENIDKVRKGLQPIQKLSTVNDQVNELQNKLQIKE